MTEETAIMRALKNEQARLETMRIINLIRRMGGTKYILRLAGAILSAPEEHPKTA